MSIGNKFNDTPQGWICPSCNKVNAPWIPQCSCNTIKDAPLPPPEPSFKQVCEDEVRRIIKDYEKIVNEKMCPDCNEWGEAAHPYGDLCCPKCKKLI